MILLLAMGGLAFLVGLMLNGSTIFIISRGKERAIDLMWSLNLAIVNFIFFSLLPLRVWSMNTSVGVDILLMLNSAITAVYMVSRAFFLAAMTTCCAISILFPVWLGKSQAFHWAFVASLVIWALSFAFSMRYQDLWEVLMLLRTDQDEGLTTRPLSTSFLIWFLCLLTLMIMCYSIHTNKQKESYHASSRELMKWPFIFLLTFFLCWLPYHVLYFLLVTWLEDSPTIFSPGFFWMAFLLPYLNCCCDAITMICLSKTQKFGSHLQQSDGQQAPGEGEV